MYYKLGQACVRNWGSFIVTNWGSYYKLGQPLLQNRTAITNWGKIYYKQGQVLQIRSNITNWGIKESYKIGCAHSSVLLSVLSTMWVFSSNWVISFFFNFSMVVEIGMNLCVTEPDILEKLFLPQQLGKRSQNRIF